jgi:hypothetical protein
MRVLELRVAGTTVGLPLNDVVEISAAPSAGEATCDLGAALGVPAGSAVAGLGAVVQLHTSTGPFAVSVSAAGGIVEGELLAAPALPAAHGGALPFSGVVVRPDRPLLVVDPGRLAAWWRRGHDSASSDPAPARPGSLAPALLGSLAPARPDGPGASSAAEPPLPPIPPTVSGPTAAEPVLECVPGPFRLRGRPLGVALPLARLTGITRDDRLVPVPGIRAPWCGVAVADDRVVPVCDAAALLGLTRLRPARGLSPAGKLVMLRSESGPVAVWVAGALGVIGPLHWAPAALLRPVQTHHLAGAVIRRERWTAIVHPDTLGAALISAGTAA